MKIRAAIIFLCLFLCGGAAHALQADEVMQDPVLEQRARAIGAQLRCMVCQSESINDSQADLARDLRLLIRQQLAQGGSDAEIIAFVRTRYGDEVLLSPPIQPNTYLLWLAPVLCLLGGGLAIGLWLRRRQGDSPEAT